MPFSDGRFEIIDKGATTSKSKNVSNFVNYIDTLFLFSLLLLIYWDTQEACYQTQSVQYELK